MKKFILAFLLWLPCVVRADQYFVATSGLVSGNGTSRDTPCTFGRINEIRLEKGDEVFFRRGDRFEGTLKASDGVFYGAYGIGPDPVITGLRTLKGWTRHAGNIYFTQLDVNELNVVVFNGRLTPMGRYPRSGFIQYTTANGNYSVGGAGISGIPFNPAGGEVVIRKSGQITDRHRINRKLGNQLILDTTVHGYGTVYFNNLKNTPNTGNGLFIQGHLSTLTAKGDWYYDRLSRRFYMCFYGAAPGSQDVQVAIADQNIELNNRSGITFSNLVFEGSDAGVGGRPASNIRQIHFKSCSFSKHYMGFDTDNGVNDLTFRNCSFTDLLATAVAGYDVNDVLIDSCSFRNIGIINGAAGSGDGYQIGVSLNGNNLAVKNSEFTSIGFHAIVLNGNNTLIERNRIDSFGITRSDCGAIYDYQFPGVVSYSKVIRDNVITNGVGDFRGNNSPGQAAGIYMDVNVNHTDIYNNTIDNGYWGGIVLIDSRDLNIYNNHVRNYREGCLYIIDYAGLANINVHSNDFLNDGKKPVIHIEADSLAHIRNYGSFWNNRYQGTGRPVKINRRGGSLPVLLTLKQWQSGYHPDKGSTFTLTQ